LGIAIIGLESQERFGADHTSHPFRVVFEAIFGQLSTVKWATVHHLIRKAGHLLLYGPIGLVWLRAWWMSLPHSQFLVDALLALLGTAVVGCADEWHQSFHPNRTASVWDVLLDCCGAIVLQVIVYIYMRVYRPKQLACANQG
jgi:VanZ family protein